MPISGYILQKGTLLATQATDTDYFGIEVQTPGYLVGVVDDVYATTDKTAVGQYFIFKESEAIILKYGSTLYYLLEEASLIGVQNPIP